LLEGKVDIERILFVCFTNANTDTGVGYPEGLYQKMNEAKSVTRLFGVLAQHPTHWSWINIQVMEKIASVDDQTFKLVEYYKSVISDRKVQDVIQTIPDFEVDKDFYAKVKVKWNKSLEDITFGDIQDHRSKIGELFGISRTALVLLNIVKGCVEYYWLIPKVLIHNSSINLLNSRRKLSSYDILSIDFISDSKASLSQGMLPSCLLNHHQLSTSVINILVPFIV